MELLKKELMKLDIEVLKKCIINSGYNYGTKNLQKI